MIGIGGDSEYILRMKLKNIQPIIRMFQDIVRHQFGSSRSSQYSIRDPQVNTPMIPAYSFGNAFGVLSDSGRTPAQEKCIRFINQFKEYIDRQIGEDITTVASFAIEGLEAALHNTNSSERELDAHCTRIKNLYMQVIEDVNQFGYGY